MGQKLDLKMISVGDGQRVRAAAVGMRGATYWLPRAHAIVALDWANKKPDDDITRGAYIQRHAVRVDDDPFPPSPTTEGSDWPHPFQIGDVVMLKSGGHHMMVTGLRCSEGTCADPYAGQLETVSVVWSQMSQLDGFDLRADELDPRLLEHAVAPRPEGYPF